MWEIFSGGKTPYPGLNPREVVNYLDKGDRLEMPKNAACSNEMYVAIIIHMVGIYAIFYISYSLMIKCWNGNPRERPTFSQLVKSINDILVPLAGYTTVLSLRSNHET